MHFAKKLVREILEHMPSFDAVNGAGIVNGHSKFFSFLFVLCPISMLHTPILSTWLVVLNYFFIALIYSMV